MRHQLLLWALYSFCGQTALAESVKAVAQDMTYLQGAIVYRSTRKTLITKRQEKPLVLLKCAKHFGLDGGRRFATQWTFSGKLTGRKCLVT